jgi:CheY-like chemotaxis protein
MAVRSGLNQNPAKEAPSILLFQNTWHKMKLKKKLSCILLIDDDYDDNVFHKIIIQKMDIAETIDEANDGVEALEHLKARSAPPELIFLDINMPRMNGWEFLERYKDMPAKQKAKTVIMMLSTSANPDEIKKAQQIEEVSGFKTKPLSKEMLTEIMQQYFGDYLG